MNYRKTLNCYLLEILEFSIITRLTKVDNICSLILREYILLDKLYKMCAIAS